MRIAATVRLCGHEGRGRPLAGWAGVPLTRLERRLQTGGAACLSGRASLTGNPHTKLRPPVWRCEHDHWRIIELAAARVSTFGGRGRHTSLPRAQGLEVVGPDWG